MAKRQLLKSADTGEKKKKGTAIPRHDRNFYIVEMGASAGGLEAF